MNGGCNVSHDTTGESHVALIVVGRAGLEPATVRL